MKGVVFNLLEQVVTQEHGARVWDDLLERAGVDGAYTAVGTYEDTELVKLVQAASEALTLPADDVVRWFGRLAIPLLAERYPVFFEGHTATRPFVLTLNEVIHPEVRKLFPGAYAPEFTFGESASGDLVLGYRSHRNLCAFAEGLLQGAAGHYGQVVTLDHTSCAKRGDENCVWVCRFEPAPEA